MSFICPPFRNKILDFTGLGEKGYIENQFKESENNNVEINIHLDEGASQKSICQPLIKVSGFIM